MEQSIRVTHRTTNGDETREQIIEIGAAPRLSISLPKFGISDFLKSEAAETAIVDRVTDQSPRLEWSRTLTDKCVDYDTAEKACAALGEGWRLPTRQELESILDLSRHNPAADPERFPDMKSDWYWSSTPCAWSSDLAWCVDFNVGYVHYYHRVSLSAFARAVRSVPVGQ